MQFDFVRGRSEMSTALKLEPSVHVYLARDLNLLILLDLSGVRVTEVKKTSG